MATKGKKRSSKKGKGSSARLLFVLLVGMILGAGGLFVYNNWQRIASYMSSSLKRNVSGAYKLPEDEIIGIDVSKYQGKIDWQKACFKYRPQSRVLTTSASDKTRQIDFVYAKVTQGVKLVDKTYKTNQAGCRKQGIPFGAYHFFEPGKSASAQARHFIDNAGLRSGDMVPMLDVESVGRLSRADLRADVLEWLKIVEKKYGKAPILYCNLSYYMKYFADPQFKKYKFWIAAYSRNFLIVDYSIWQQTENGIVYGIKGFVDIDVFHGTRADFNKCRL